MYDLSFSETIPVPAMKNKLKEKLLSGSKTLGTFLEMGGASTVECLARGGFDYLIIDTEHGPFSVETAADYIRVAEYGGITPLVRICEITRSSVLRMLDVGAKGLIVPNIHTAHQVEELVRLAKFAPLGQRGFCPTRVSCWGADAWAADANSYVKRCNDETLILPQCETAQAYENIDEILAVEGVDGIFVGPCDLSIALGVPFEFDSPKLKNAILHILDACKRANKQAFIFAGNPEAAREWFAAGFDSVTYSLDASIFVKACREAVSECKNLIK